MKRIAIIAALAMCFAANAQSYNWGVGASISGNNGGLHLGVGYLDLGLGARFYF